MKFNGDLSDLSERFASAGVIFPKEQAAIRISDSDITGGRCIVGKKSNSLFTGVFEREDLEQFLEIWSQYRPGASQTLKNRLLRQCRNINQQYNKEVCPLEAMLYTSISITSRFGDMRLIDDLADVVYEVWEEENDYMASIRHIVTVWKWKHVINVCAVAAGRIKDPELLRFLFDHYHSDEEIKPYVFFGMLESGLDEFEGDILNMFRELDGSTETERQMGKRFKTDFRKYFPDSCQKLSIDMFEKASPYVKGIIADILGRPTDWTTLYNNAKTEEEKKRIVEAGFSKLFDSKEQAGIYNAVNMLRLAQTPELSRRIYEKLDLNHTKGVKRSSVVPAISYFNTVAYEPAQQKLKTVGKDSTYYAAARLALYHQGAISSDELMEDFLTEGHPDRLKNFMSGFYGMTHKGNEIQDSAFRYLSREDLSEAALSRAIDNYRRLIKKYRHLYDARLLQLICEWFGYRTAFRTVKIRMADQVACLDIIEAVLNSANYDKYGGFLYYVGEAGTAFNATVRIKARMLMRDMPLKTIKA